MNCQPVLTGNHSNSSAGIQEHFDAGKAGKGNVQQYVLLLLWSTGSKDPQNTDADATFEVKEPKSEVHVSLSSSNKTKKHNEKTKREAKGKSGCGDDAIDGGCHGRVIVYEGDDEGDGGGCREDGGTAMQEELLQFKMQKVWVLVDLPKGKRAIGSKCVFRNKKDEKGIVIRNKARLVTQRHTQEEGIDYEEVFSPVARIEAIRLFLAYASFMGFMIYQMYVKSAFLYGIIEEEVYVCQPPRFGDPDYPDKVYVDDIIFGSTNKELCKAFKKFMKDKFQMSSIDGKSAGTPIDTKKLKDPDGGDVDVHTYKSMIGLLMYLTSSRPYIMFFVCACVHFQVTPKALHLHAVKRIFRYIKGKPHLGLWYPKDSPFDLVAYFDSDYAGASLDRKSTIGGCQFLCCRLISWKCKNQTVVATSSTEAEYVAAASCYAQVLWIQNYNEALAIPGQTATGKENSNPFMAYALMVNPTIYVSCIKQFWTSVSVKKTNDVVRLQALIDKKKVIITLDSIRQALRLDDAGSVNCLPNEEIFAELARMGLVRNVDNPSKFLIYLRFIKLMINAQVGDLSSHTTKYASPALTQKVFANIRTIGKGFSGVDTPLFDGMLVPQQAPNVEDAVEDENDENVVSVEPTPPSSTPTIPSSSPTQEHIPSPPQA
nr:hypothetical protein [Tanacetum cinerariifolium]